MIRSITFSISSFVIFCMVSFEIVAQPVDRKGIVGISAGVAVPVSNFASTDTNNMDAGYARTGFSGYLLPHVNIYEFLGFAGLLGYSNNTYNVSELETQYQMNNPSRRYSFSSDPYGMINIMGGISLTVPQGSLDLTLKGYIGLAVATLPATESFLYPAQAGDPLLELRTEKNRGNAVSYGGGLNLLFSASEKMAITFDALYLYSNPEFNAVEISVYENGQLTALSGIDLRQKFQIIHLGLGVAYLF